MPLSNKKLTSQIFKIVRVCIIVRIQMIGDLKSAV